jgi:hypothetical protein
MFSSTYLDTIISMILVYALLSVVVSLLLETWNKFMKHRGAFLQQAIFRLLDDPLNHNLGYLIYQHPMINRQRNSGNSYPKYISGVTFSKALIDTIAEYSSDIRYVVKKGRYEKEVMSDPNLTLAERFCKGVENMKDSEMKIFYKSFIHGCTTEKKLDLKQLSLDLAAWYDDYMEGITGEYKSSNRRKLIILGLAVAFMLNVDTFHLAHMFYNNKSLRESVVKNATEVATVLQDSAYLRDSENYSLVLRVLADSTISKKDTNTINYLSQLQKQLSDKKLMDSAYSQQMDSIFDIFNAWEIPLGYNKYDAPFSWFNKQEGSLKGKGINAVQNKSIAYHEKRNQLSLSSFIRWFLGVFITGIALGFGAPFWFEVLVKFINLRSAGTKPFTALTKKTSGNS